MLARVVEQSEIVYYLAGWLANTALPADADEVFVTNCLATAVLCRLCERRGVRLVFTSSHSVYLAGAYEGLIREDGYCRLADRAIAGGGAPAMADARSERAVGRRCRRARRVRHPGRGRAATAPF